jgi:hypothetical protein
MWLLKVVEGDPAFNFGPRLQSGFPCVQVDASLLEGSPKGIDEDDVAAGRPVFRHDILTDSFIRRDYPTLERPRSSAWHEGVGMRRRQIAARFQATSLPPVAGC